MSKYITLGRQVVYNEDGSYELGEKVRVPLEIFRGGHSHIRGCTRSGKTSLAIATIVRFLLHLFGRDTEEKPDAMVFIDLGGDRTFFHLVRYLADHLPLKRIFRFFSLEEEDDWSFFDAFELARGLNVRIMRICNFCVSSLQLDHGLVYGGAYFTAKAVGALLRVIRRVVRKESEGQSLDLDDIRLYLDETKQRDEDAVSMAIQFLCEYPQLKPPAETDKIIRFSRVIEDGELAYFMLPTMSDPVSSRQIAGLALFSLINAAMERDRKGLPPRHVYVFVDEWQEIASRGFGRVLSQCGKFNLTLVCANQTTSQLKNSDIDLADTIRDNTLLKIYFTVTGRNDIEEIQTFSKDDPNYYLASEGGFGTNSMRQVIVPRLKKDTILDCSATDRHALVIFSDGKHREPTPVQFDFSVDRETYDFWKQSPLPRFEGTRDSAPIDNAEASTEPRWKTLRGNDLSKAHQYAIDRILQRKIAAERPNDE